MDDAISVLLILLGALLGAAFALVGGLISEAWRTRRAARAAAVAIYLELGQHQAALGNWLLVAIKAAAVPAEDAPSTRYSPDELIALAEDEREVYGASSERLRSFPRLERAAWDGVRMQFAQSWAVDQIAIVGRWYVHSSEAEVRSHRAVELLQSLEAAQRACEQVMDLTAERKAETVLRKLLG